MLIKVYVGIAKVPYDCRTQPTLRSVGARSVSRHVSVVDIRGGIERIYTLDDKHRRGQRKRSIGLIFASWTSRGTARHDLSLDQMRSVMVPLCRLPSCLLNAPSWPYFGIMPTLQSAHAANYMVYLVQMPSRVSRNIVGCHNMLLRNSWSRFGHWIGRLRRSNCPCS